jgi:hypothetical protein
MVELSVVLLMPLNQVQLILLIVQLIKLSEIWILVLTKEMNYSISTRYTTHWLCSTVFQILDAADVIEEPDDLSIMTYVSFFRGYLRNTSAFAANCYAEGPGLTMAVTGKQGIFTVQAVNQQGEKATVVRQSYTHHLPPSPAFVYSFCFLGESTCTL